MSLCYRCETSVPESVVQLRSVSLEGKAARVLARGSLETCKGMCLVAAQAHITLHGLWSLKNKRVQERMRIAQTLTAVAAQRLRCYGRGGSGHLLMFACHGSGSPPCRDAIGLPVLVMEMCKAHRYTGLPSQEERCRRSHSSSDAQILRL